VNAWAIPLLADAPQLKGARLVLLIALIAAVGTAISAVGNLLEDLFDIPLGGDLFSWGGMIGAIGLLVGAVLVLTVNDRLRRSGLFLAGFIAGGIFPDDRGQFLSGVALLGLGDWLFASHRELSHSITTATVRSDQ